MLIVAITVATVWVGATDVDDSVDPPQALSIATAMYTPTIRLFIAANLNPCQQDTTSERERRMAEGEGFEPPEPFPVQWFSRPPPSTTRPSLRALHQSVTCGARPVSTLRHCL